ncbi:Domain of uncharacterised function (DUF2825) [Raoultella terrigena]|uniref:Domain of uncharacterized function (DUF2825) n=1 Tax=Raoultella terrigena TaxID=577 RepID=A0A485CCL9_RAOTE|nr:Domain of uncharacterised function (DUF2825) [Raoultella terrigena]
MLFDHEINETVYPRWRGEHSQVDVNLVLLIGLSPLARGTPEVHAVDVAGHRFIPAGAGNTEYWPTERRSGSVYPRWRGEHLCRSAKSSRRRGLSPLARGTLEVRLPHLHERQFIPAGAGNTQHSQQMIAMASVYPRWRGEHSTLSTNDCDGIGLSPLARGTLITGGHNCALIRFIPAGAGNTPRARHTSACRSVYPRWRGEHSVSRHWRLTPFGLSPLARGTRIRYIKKER